MTERTTRIGKYTAMAQMAEILLDKHGFEVVDTRLLDGEWRIELASGQHVSIDDHGGIVVRGKETERVERALTELGVGRPYKLLWGCLVN